MDQIALACAVTGRSTWERWYHHEYGRDVIQFTGKDLREIVFQFRDIWNVPPPDDDSVSFAIGVYANEIRECIQSCGMAPRVETRSKALVPIISPTRVSRSSVNQFSNVQLFPEVVDVSEVVSPSIQGLGINLQISFRFISLEYLRQITIKELATLEYIVYTMNNGIEIDTQYLTMPADVTMAEVLALDSRRKTTMTQHIIIVRNDFISDQVFQPVNSRLLLDWLNDAIKYNKHNDNASGICNPKFEIQNPNTIIQDPTTPESKSNIRAPKSEV